MAEVHAECLRNWDMIRSQEQRQNRARVLLSAFHGLQQQEMTDHLCDPPAILAGASERLTRSMASLNSALIFMYEESEGVSSPVDPILQGSSCYSFSETSEDTKAASSTKAGGLVPMED